jgi:glycosyltransferase involved in cell wall biosynthesis
MKFSVAICTWNRAALLQRTLESLCQLRLPAGWHWQVVLVDNNSTDETPQVIRDLTSRLPLRSVQEPRQGHSAARNRAVESCDGDVIVWTDDDVEVDPRWLIEYGTTIDRTPEASFWGGPIRPKFLASRPSWLVKNWGVCQGCFAARELGDEAIELTADRLPYGANFAVRTPILRRFPFDEKLGRKGDKLIGDDEVDVLQRIIGAGHRGYWVPGAAVHHLIPPERMTLDYVRRYFVGQGYRLVGTGKGSRRTIAALRRDAVIQRWIFRLKYRFAQSPAWLAHWIRAALAEGESLGRLEQAASLGGGDSVRISGQ